MERNRGRPKVRGADRFGPRPADIGNDHGSSVEDACLRVPLPAQFAQNLIQPESLDELHDVIEGALMLADPVDGNDVGMVQSGGGPGFALEALLLLGIGQRLGGKHLEGNAPPERLLLGLVDDAHATVPDLAQDSVVAQAFGVVAGRWQETAGAEASSQVAGPRFEVFEQDDSVEQVADLLGTGGIAGDVFGHVNLFAAAPAGTPIRRPSVQSGLCS